MVGPGGVGVHVEVHVGGGLADLDLATSPASSAAWVWFSTTRRPRASTTVTLAVALASSVPLSAATTAVSTVCPVTGRESSSTCRRWTSWAGKGPSRASSVPFEARCTEATGSRVPSSGGVRFTSRSARVAFAGSSAVRLTRVPSGACTCTR